MIRVLCPLGALMLAVAGLAVLSVPLARQTHVAGETLDFANFYAAGRIVRSGQAGRLYDFELQRQVENTYSTGGPFMAYLHPPFEALVFAILAGLSYTRAFLVLGVVNLVVVAIIVLLLRGAGPQLGGVSYLLWVLICLFFVVADLALGQDALWLAVVYLLCFLCLKRRRDIAAGAALGLGLFRFEFILPFVLIFLLRKRWRVAAGFSVVGAAGLLTSAAVVGWGGILRYVETLARVASSARGVYVDRSDAAMMPSLYGWLEPLLEGRIPQVAISLIVLGATAAVLGWAAWRFRHLDLTGNPAFELEFSVALLASLLAGYHVFISELTPVIVVAYLILAYESGQRRHCGTGGHLGAALLALFLAVIAVLILSRSQRFSLEVIIMLALAAWLTLEASRFKRVGPPKQEAGS